MLDYDVVSEFNKNRKLMQKRGRDIHLLREVMFMLINEQPLLPKHENHPLRGKLRGKWECHVQPDWLLIYRIDKANNKITFYNTGTHSDLF
jgi:mRNA interferase YafQ